MAHGALTKMRLATGDDVMRHLEVDGSPGLAKYCSGIKSSRLKLITVSWAGTFNNGYQEIGAPNAIFDGTGTAAVVYVDSTSGDDAAGGAGTQEVTIIGLDENDHIVAVPVATGGTTGTSSVVKFKRIFHAYASAWGAGNDTVGDMYIQDDVTGTAKFLKMAATYNETEGSAVFCPVGALVTLESLYLVMTSSANANAALLIKHSAINVNGVGADPEFMYMEHRTTISAGGLKEMDPGFNSCQEGAKITLSETYKGAAEDGQMIAHILVIEDE